MENRFHIERFESATIVLPVVNETTSLKQTVDIILRDVKREDIRELLVVTCKKTTGGSVHLHGKLTRRSFSRSSGGFLPPESHAPRINR